MKKDKAGGETDDRTSKARWGPVQMDALHTRLSEGVHYQTEKAMDSVIIDLQTMQAETNQQEGVLPIDPRTDMDKCDESMRTGISFPPDTAIEEAPGRPKRTRPLKPWGTVYRAGDDAAVVSKASGALRPKWRKGTLP